ncbi:reelin domain-containing protein 1-like [Cyprinus carpio]|uniref:Reelin domain-containing protein 1-like n=1 Tax=Cyprinus carpio TaxID=7962 RepID=A0A9Q9ZQB0_CYPCA|nr:reelin domain-containing protein 1-like [Cyprinus carpio]
MMMMMMLMKAVLAGCVIVCVFPAHGVCFSRGASVSSCVNMKPGHISSFPQHTHSSVTIRTSRSVYLPQHTLTVTVQSSRAFMGFLLQARSVLEDRLVGGEFMLHPPSTHTLSCLSADDTVTHSDKMLKRNLSFSWRAPTQSSGDLRFYITLVQSYFVYWTRIRSAVVHDGTRSSLITDSITGQPAVNTTGDYDQTSTHTLYTQ